ncbi:MAG: hypothetical protein P1S46_06095 [bacterium]|nr:hypothetical protein [bacterium]MDT8395582.1 hypothetical protein [bacterium]
MSKRKITMTAALALVLFCSGAAAAAETALIGDSMGACMGEEGFETAWLDRIHSYITRTLCQPSVWFDNFFGEQRSGEEWPGSLVRWRSSFRRDEKEGDLFGSGVSASLRLPKMSQKFRLIITSQDNDLDAPGHPGEDPFLQDTDPGVTADTKRSAAGLRYDLSDTRRARLHLGAGFRLTDTVEPYVRLRLRVTEPLSSHTLVRLTPAVVWFRDEGINQSFRIDFDWRLGESALARATEAALWKEVEPGVQWGSALSLFDRLGPTVVAGIEGSAEGNTYPKNDVARYRLVTRIRSNFIRPWLFLEAAPELYWPRDDTGRYRRYKATTLRIEVQFFS